MAQTYTTQFFDVSDGDTTTHNPQSLAPTTTEIRILDAEIKWEGVEGTSEVTVRNGPNVNTVRNKAPGNAVVSVGFPSVPDNTTYERSFMKGFVTTDDAFPQNHSFFMDYPQPDGNEFSESSESSEYDQYSDGFTKVMGRQQLRGPFGSTEGRFGLNASFGSWDLRVKSFVDGVRTETTVNPQVTGDVSADSGNGTVLADGEQSRWYSLSGLDANSETFKHDISESQQARFRFRFSFEKILPDPTNGTVAFADTSNGVFHEVAVADPTDDALDYNHVQIYNKSTGNWGALDVVNVTDTDALEQFAFYDSNAGWLAPRPRSTTPI